MRVYQNDAWLFLCVPQKCWADSDFRDAKIGVPLHNPRIPESAEACWPGIGLRHFVGAVRLFEDDL